jgi:V/A-type H+-transporting ATPase subunit F
MSDSIAFLGSKDTVAGFVALGVEAYPVADRAEARTALRRCRAEKTAVVFVTEEVAAMLDDELAALRFEPTPAILVVPSAIGGEEFGLKRLKILVEKAVGADILSREET